MPFHQMIWGTAAAAALAASAAVLWRLAKRSRKEKIPDGSDKERQLLIEGISHNARLYDGLYEGIYQAAHQENVSTRDPAKEFCGRTRDLEDQGPFSAAFTARFSASLDADPITFRERMGELLELIYAAGITRRETGEVLMDPKTHKDYICLGAVPEEGAACRVVKPCWERGNALLEQGILMAKEGQQ